MEGLRDTLGPDTMRKATEQRERTQGEKLFLSFFFAESRPKQVSPVYMASSGTGKGLKSLTLKKPQPIWLWLSWQKGMRHGCRIMMSVAHRCRSRQVIEIPGTLRSSSSKICYSKEKRHQNEIHQGDLWPKMPLESKKKVYFFMSCLKLKRPCSGPYFSSAVAHFLLLPSPKNSKYAPFPPPPT